MINHLYTIELDDELDLIYIKRLLIRIIAEEDQGVSHDDAVIALAHRLLTQVIIKLDKMAKVRGDD